MALMARVHSFRMVIPILGRLRRPPARPARERAPRTLGSRSAKRGGLFTAVVFGQALAARAQASLRLSFLDKSMACRSDAYCDSHRSQQRGRCNSSQGDAGHSAHERRNRKVAHSAARPGVAAAKAAAEWFTCDRRYGDERRRSSLEGHHVRAATRQGHQLARNRGKKHSIDLDGSNLAYLIERAIDEVRAGA